MDQKIVGIVGAIAGLAALDATQGAATAAPNPEGVPSAKSFADLLDPIPNALAMLRAVDAAAATRSQDEAGQTADVKLAQWHHHHHPRVIACDFADDSRASYITFGIARADF